MQKEEIKIYWLVAILMVSGSLIAIGRLLQSKEEITVRLFFGRAITSAMMSLSVLAGLHIFPAMSVEVLLGVSIFVGVMGEQFFEIVLNKFLKTKMEIK